VTNKLIEDLFLADDLEAAGAAKRRSCPCPIPALWG